MKLLWYLSLSIILVMISYANKLTQKLLLISMDGFRWDYLDNTANTPNFDKFVREGVRVKQVRNVFSTLTFPNHWTLVTGQYEEATGIIANKMYDPVFREEFSYGSDTKWFEENEPIWITAIKENLTSATYMWVGNMAEYDGKRATKTVPFKNGVDFDVSVKKIIEWLAEDNVNFACLYINEPDSTGHRFGPNSEELKEKIRDLDKLLGRIMQQMDSHDLTKAVNVIIASDHGMAEVSNDRSINLGKYINSSDIEWWYTSVIGHILPKENKTQQVYEALKSADEPHLHVYLKEDIPEELHYKNHRRIMPIFLMTDEGWVMKKGNYKMSLDGNHGFNNSWDDMKSFFVARGPNFKCGYKQNHLEVVDVYPLMCHLLGLKTCHEGPGSLDKTMSMMTLQDNCLVWNSANSIMISQTFLLLIIRSFMQFI